VQQKLALLIISESKSKKIVK